MRTSFLRWIAAGCSLVTGFGATLEPVPTRAASVRFERVKVRDGAELITTIYKLPSGDDFPVISVLKDTLGDDDPADDLLRQVWIPTYTKPSILQRIAAAVPFLYARTGGASKSGDHRPAAVLDMNSVGKNTFWKLGHVVVQSELVDPINMPVRLSSRAYGGNAAAYRNVHIWQSLALLSSVPSSDVEPYLSANELDRIQARLALSTRLFGDMVTEQYLPLVQEKMERANEEMRGHNWDLLRQKAEDNQLYFEPLRVIDNGPAHALVWVERDASLPASGYHGQLLGIANPYEGHWRKNWTGYTEWWRFDAEGNRIEDGVPAARIAEMIPVALYSLDHPRVPLLLIDFQQPSKPKRHEMLRRATDDVATGVLQLTRFGNWSFFAGHLAWTFVRTRHGATEDRSARLRSYAQLKHALYLDPDMRPQLRDELIRRAEMLGLNPFERSIPDEARIARQQYANLKAYITDSSNFTQKLQAQRSSELERMTTSRTQRFWYRSGAVASLGLYRHRIPETPEFLAQLSDQRRFRSNVKFLQDVLASGAQPEVVYDMNEIRRSLDTLTEIGNRQPALSEESERMVRSVLARTTDEKTRQHCFECLERLTAKRDAPKSLPVPVPSTHVVEAGAGASQ